MKRLTPYLIGAIVGVLVLGAFTLGQVSAAPMAATGCFPDTNGHWAETFICWASEFGVVGGFPDGTYGPDQNITRGQAAVMLNRTAALTRATGTQFDSLGTSVASNTFRDYAEVTINAPVDGALLVNGSLNLYCSGLLAPCVTSNGNVYVNVNDTNYNRQFYAVENSAVENQKAWNSSNNAYVPVSAGMHTVRLRVVNSGNTPNPTYVWSGGINVLFIPFDGSGSPVLIPSAMTPEDVDGARLQGLQE